MRFELRLVLAIVLTAAGAWGQQATPGGSGVSGDTGKPAAKAAPEAAPDYKIGPQDVLRIDVWKEPEISRTIPVRPDGKISLPLLNDVQAEGLTAMQLAGVLREGLTKYITSPQVTVMVTEINSRRVYCNGELARPGAIALLPNMTALQAISTCGGFTQFARIKNMYILRTTSGKQEQIPFHYKDVVKGKAEDMQLKSGDVIVVP